MRLILAFIMAAFTPMLANADINKEIAKCAQKSGELERLECYDNLAKNNGLAGPQEQPSSVGDSGKWEVRTTINPVDDSKTVSLVLAANSGESRRNNAVAMIIRCQSNETDLYINWRDYLGSEAEVLTRVGSQKAITKNWSLSTDSQSAFYPSNPIGFIKEMMTASKLVAQVTPFNENPVTAIFNTTGLENAIVPLRETCSW